jgi:hypothetical protein
MIDSPRWLRIVIVGALVALPLLVVCTTDRLEHPVDLAMESWSTWSALAFLAMLGPGQWRAAIGGTLYLIVLGFAALFLFRWFRPVDFVSWNTFLNIDVWAVGFRLIKGWCVIRILSMVTGLEFIDPRTKARPRWSILRWFYLMIVLAVLLQTAVAETNWNAELSVVHAEGADAAGPLPEPPVVTTRRVWFGIQSAELLFIPFVPLLCAAWMLAGRSWRLLLFPALGGISIASYALAELAFQQAVYEESWSRALYPALKKEWALLGTVSWFAYGFSAILVLWMGFRWTDYWTKVPSVPQADTSQ